MHQPTTSRKTFNVMLCIILEKVVDKNKKVWLEKLHKTLCAYKNYHKDPQPDYAMLVGP